MRPSMPGSPGYAAIAALALALILVLLAYAYTLLSARQTPVTVTVTSVATVPETITAREVVTETRVSVSTVTITLTVTKTLTVYEKFPVTTSSVTTVSRGEGGRHATTTRSGAWEGSRGRSPVEVRVRGGNLIVTVKGGIDNIGFYNATSIFPYATVPLNPASTVLLGETIPPQLVVIDTGSNTLRIVVPLEGIVNNTLAVIWGVNGTRVAEFRIVESGGGYSIEGLRVYPEKLPGICESLEALRDEYPALYALACGINATTLSILRSELGGVLSGGLPGVAWRLLAWEEKSIEYNDTVPGVETPLEMLRVRRGKCIDYAVFTAAALLAAGAKSVYIAEVYSELGRFTLASGHAFTVLPYKGSLIVLDQKLPPVELEDYEAYILRGARQRLYIKLELLQGGHVRLTTGTGLRLDARDSYPEDTLPEHVVRNAAILLAGKLGAKLDENVLGDYRYEVDVYLCRCTIDVASPIQLCISCEIPLSKLYSPIFERFWPEYLASKIYRQLLEASVKQGEYGRVWVEYEQKAHEDVFRVYLG